MTITTARIYYSPRSKRLERKLTQNHWGFAEWFLRRLKPIREQLRGPEAKGVNIVNFMLHEVADHAWYPNEWKQRANTFNFSFVCDLQPLNDAEPILNIEKLMGFTSIVALSAPWPQVRAVGLALGQPLSASDRESLAPFLKWPRESIYVR
ncbi:MAG: hypothetical protein AB7I35_08690 [Ramlibacter sp.]